MGLVLIFIVIAVFIFFFILFLKSTRGSLIEKIDDQGLTTKSGKFYPWEELDRIEFNILKHRASDKKKVQAVHFYFKTGKASAGYIMKNIDAVIQKADQLQVPKSERVVGMYVR